MIMTIISNNIFTIYVNRNISILYVLEIISIHFKFKISHIMGEGGVGLNMKD